MPSGTHVVDIACSTGALMAIVSRNKNNTVCGIEPDSVRVTARMYGIGVYDGVPNETFSSRHPPMALLADVLAHVTAPAELLSRAVGVLKPGGLALLRVPNIAHWTIRLGVLRGRFDHTETGILDSTHLRWFAEKTIVALCGTCGQEVLVVRQTAGNDQPEYRAGSPWKLRPERIRRRMVRRLAGRLPRLFGRQYVIAAPVPAA